MTENERDEIIIELYDAVYELDHENFIDIVETSGFLKVAKYTVFDKKTGYALRNINDETVQDQFKLTISNITDDYNECDLEFAAEENPATRTEKLNEFVEAVNEHFNHTLFKLTKKSSLKLAD